MKHSILYIITTFILLGCDKKNTPTTSEMNMTTAGMLPEMGVKEFISTSPFVILDKNGKSLIELSEEKKVFVYGMHRANLDGEGEMLSPEGNFIAMLNRGNILVNQYQTPLIKLKDDGSVDYGSGIVLHWSKDGELMHGVNSMNCSIQPVKKESLKTAGMLYYYFLFRK